MATPESLQLPPHTLRHLLDKGSALWITPMEPQPRRYPGYRGMTCLGKGKAPHRVGDLVDFATGETTAPESWPSWGMRTPVLQRATVTGVEVKRVREMDKPTQYLTMAPSGYWPKEWWAETYPDHPFDTAWAWVLGLSLERKDRK